ncbi:MAG: rhomboid family intramembrane serine protease [Frankia sp.]
MNQASVGFQCPEELRGGGSGRSGGSGSADPADRADRPSRTWARSGGGAARQASNPARRVHSRFGGDPAHAGRPVVTQVLVALCVLAYLLQGAPGLGLAASGSANRFTNRYFLDGFAIAEQHQYYRLLTAAFLHASLLHILFNMYALYLLGFQLEAALGRVRFLALFIVSSIGGSTLSFLVHGLQTSSLGASTGIFGMFAAYYLVARRMQVNTGPILIVVGINLLLTFFVAGIDKFGHIGGLITGAVIGVILTMVPPRQRVLQGVLVGAVFVLLIVAVAIKVESLPSLFPSVPGGGNI